MNDRYVIFKDSDSNMACIRVKDIRNIIHAYDKMYLVVYDTPTKKRKWDTVMITEEEAEHLAQGLVVFAWKPR